MVENLVNLDKRIFLSLNHFASPGMDPVMLFLSGPVPWILFFLTVLIVLWFDTRQKFRYRYLIILLSIGLTYAIGDQSSVQLFKEVFMRLRPCHEPSLAGQVRLVAGHCGGQYGFVSSHATNSFALGVVSLLLVRRKWFTISVMTWATLVSYSRIYLGVHYPGDVIGGMVLGSLIGIGMYTGTRFFLKRAEERTADLKSGDGANQQISI
jgi:undecaprenyl-diphosphatase